MTKKQALQKIEELKQFVEKCEDEEKGFKHGDLVDYSCGERIIIDVSKLKRSDLNNKFLVLDEYGHCTGSSNDSNFLFYTYTKIKNVFKDD